MAQRTAQAAPVDVSADVSADVSTETPATAMRDVAPVSGSATGARARHGTERAVTIERLILHALDHRTGRCELVDEEATLDEAGQRFFASHVASAAERADWHARFRPDDDAVPAHLAALLGESQQFVTASKALAERLYTYMRERAGTIAPGDFVVIAYHIGDESTRHVALLKMDPDQQRLLRSFTRHNGQRRVAISHAQHLLPEAKSLQKCALISHDAASNTFSVRLLDTQAGPRSDGVAAFFYRDFLASTLTASARRQTRLFLAETNGWINRYSAEFSARELLAFFAARRAALGGDRVRLRAFATEALPTRPDLRDDLLQRLIPTVLDDADLNGEHPFFPVDRAAARKYLDNVTLELDGGVRVIVPASRFAELVRIAEERTGEGKLRLTLESLALREVTS